MRCSSFASSSSASLCWLVMSNLWLQQAPLVIVHQIVVKNRTTCFSVSHSVRNLHQRGVLQLSPDEQFPDYTQRKYGDSEDNHLFDFPDGKNLDERFEISRPIKKRATRPEVEIVRRQKIGLANKGRVPWNKGRQHSPETRERIRRRTIEALRDPKIRKKMAESPRSHSEQSKAKIGMSLKRIWSERLRRKRSQANCHQVWADAVAGAAKKGGLNQQELEWDSYEKMKAEILSEHQRWKAEREKQKEIEKKRAERALKARSGKTVNRCRDCKGIKEISSKKAIDRSKKMISRKSVIPSPKSAKIRAKLVKIHRRKQSEEPTIEYQAATGPPQVAEKWDLEFIKREKMRQMVSFADQILAIKQQRCDQSEETGILIRQSTDE